MTALIVLFLVLAAICFVLGCVNQRKLYWSLAAWQYRSPEAHEPSDAALAVSRLSLFTSAVVLLVFAGIVHDVYRASVYSTAEVRSVAYSAAAELNKGTESGIGSSYSTTSDVYDAVNEHGNGNVKIRSAGAEKYELTNREGKNPVCLTVAVDNQLNLGSSQPWRHSVRTSVTDGPC